MHLREGEDEFLNDWKLKTIIRKYSDHITLPILMKKSEWKDGEQVPTDEDETVNKASALWARAKTILQKKSTKSFISMFRMILKPHLAYTHSRVEGKQEYISLLYIPK